MFILKLPVLLRLFLLSLLLTVAQQTIANTPDYTKVYHPVIYEAEQFILVKDYAAALDKYKAAFKEAPEPFARDYYNAAVCAVLAENHSQAIDYLNKLILKGVTLEYLQKKEVFAPLHDSRAWKKLEKKYPKHRRKYKRKADLDLRADLDELYARDRYYRFAEGGLRVYADTLRKIENDNVDILLRNIQKHGYPGEKLIGVGDTIEQLPRFSIVIERQTKAKKGFDFSDILKEAVQNGSLSPQAAAYLIETQQGNRSYNTRALVRVECSNNKDCEGSKKLKKLNKYLIEDLKQKQLSKVNERRALLGLEPVAEYRQKVLYSLADNRFMLANTWSVVRYMAPSREAAEVLTRGLTPIDTALADAE